jgi:microcystin-dependent protein
MDPFLAEIRIFGFGVVPRGWALCNGQLLSISQNTALFSLIGNLYGGDGRVTFGLPNFQGALSISQGLSTAGSTYFPGDSGGAPTVTLSPGQMAQHNHSLNVSTRPAKARQPGGSMLAVGVGALMYNTVQQPTTLLDPTNSIGPAGGSAPHNNLMPYLTLSWCIALQGIYPQRPLAEEERPVGAVLRVPEPGADIEVHSPDALPEDETLIVFGEEEGDGDE